MSAGPLHRPLLTAVVAAAVAGAVLAGCSTPVSAPQQSSVPGAPKAADTKTLEAGAAAMQSRPPLQALNAYLDGFHFSNGRPADQMEAHHYCAILSEELIQCVIHDGSTREARIMGVEYIVSQKLFDTLPRAEKALWHSHVHEVKSGQLIAPGIPQAAEHALMKKLVSTYGKTWHTWHTQQDALPIGVPQLMMGFTADGQAHAPMVAERDRRFGIDSAERRRQRADIEAPPIDPDADSWQRGRIIQLGDPTAPARASRGAPARASTPAPAPARASTPAPVRARSEAP